MGPTASGKTDLAFAIADEFPCEIISVDSVMVYRDLNIGSAKPSLEVLQQYPHHLVDILNPEESYSVANFREDALRLIKQAHENNKVPLLVGGTMLYFSALLRGLSKMPSANTEVRKKISDIADDKGWEFVHAELAKIDPAAAERIHPNDPQRLQRAMEVYELTGISMSDWHAKSQHNKAKQNESQKNKNGQNEIPFNALKLALIPEDRARLHKRIELRFDQMLQQGFLEEAQALFQRETLHVDLPSMRSVGYRQAWKYFAGEYDAAMMRERAIIATRQLAKRQHTWLRSESSLFEISAEKHDIHDIRQQIQSYLA
jgi:tRNA dimethylallyltransferase